MFANTWQNIYIYYFLYCKCYIILYTITLKKSSQAEKRETELFLEKRNSKEENEQLISNLEEVSKEKDALKHEVEELRNRYVVKYE